MGVNIKTFKFDKLLRIGYYKITSKEITWSLNSEGLKPPT